jgi:hypothetical protein
MWDPFLLWKDMLWTHFYLLGLLGVDADPAPAE